MLTQPQNVAERSEKVFVYWFWSGALITQPKKTPGGMITFMPCRLLFTADHSGLSQNDNVPAGEA